MYIYNKQHSNLITYIGQLIAGFFFFIMRSCEYLVTPKGEVKQTRILKKGDIRFYRKRHKLAHNSVHIHLAYKIPPKFRTHKNGFKNATVNQWQSGKCLRQVHIWADIISILDSYPETLDETPVNTV